VQGKEKKKKSSSEKKNNLVQKRKNPVWALAHACNPSYSGGRDQEDRGSKPAQANSS
jgi:hypothetical protein